jgi:multiple antibiotic resistance protein
MDLINFLTPALTLFAVIDIFGSIPLIIKLRDTHGHINSLKGSIISFLIMIVGLYFGKTLFNLLGIETFHFGLAGSFLILYFGVKMVLGIEDKKQKKQALNATVFPIAFPLIAGPGTLSAIISLRSEYTDLSIALSILINCIIIFLVLKSANWIKEKIGTVGLTLMERIFGIILIAIGMKMFLYNLVMSIISIKELAI